MLTGMIRRLVLTSLIVISFVGTGMLFGEAKIQPLSANVVEKVSISDHTTLSGSELNLTASSRPARKAGTAFDWPFFSFRKGSR